MSELNRMNEFNRNSERQIAMNTYSACLEHVALQYPIADSEEYPVYKTPRFNLQERDGSPIMVSFTHYPNGQEYFPKIKNVTVVETEAPGIGTWIKNYHIYEKPNENLTYQKSVWLDGGAENKAQLTTLPPEKPPVNELSLLQYYIDQLT